MRTARRTLSYLPALLLLGALACREDAAPTDPTTEPASPVAAAVAPLSFRQVSAGSRHTCGLTTTDQAYCWGYNGFSTHGGQLGDGTTTQRLKPVAVLGGLHFGQISAGVDHTCGVTTDDRAYCWGRNDYGQLGDGTTESKLTPVAVGGGRRFRVVSAGNFHSCGITPANVLFCWGTNRYGVMGAAAAPDHTPVKVGGALTWRNVSAGYSHTCGATTTNAAYCWGNNSNYQLGNGRGSLVAQPPTKVSGGLSWRQVFVGSGYISESSDVRHPIMRSAAASPRPAGCTAGAAGRRAARRRRSSVRAATASSVSVPKVAPCGSLVRSTAGPVRLSPRSRPERCGSCG